MPTQTHTHTHSHLVTVKENTIKKTKTTEKKLCLGMEKEAKDTQDNTTQPHTHTYTHLRMK